MDKDKLFDCRNSSSIFYKIMKKYHKRDKNVFLSNKGYIAYAIEQKREKLQFEEKDDMYIYKEAKNIANYNELLLELYGNKAKKRFYDISKFSEPIKLDRKLFFVSDKKEETNNENKNDFAVNFINKKGIMKLPLIYKNFFYNKTRENKTTKNFITIENTNNIDRKKLLKNLLIKNEKKSSKEKSGIDALKSKIKNKSHKNINININQENKISPPSNIISKSNKNILLTTKPKNETEVESKIKQKKINNDNNIKIIKNELTLSNNYILKLSNFKDQLIKEEQKSRKYFNKNDYGCKNSKEKYNYLNSKYFH